MKKGVYLQLENKRIYAVPADDGFRFKDLYSNITGTQQGLDLDFKFPELNGTLFYGFINYKDGKHPQPVYFKRSASIINGKNKHSYCK